MKETILMALWLLGVVGWVLNIVTVWQSAQVDGMIVVRVVGIFMAPLGAVLGWL